MVFERPIIDTGELQRALDPVWGRGDAEYRRLQSARILSPGIWSSRQDEGSNTPRQMFCSLNRDAISAARRGYVETAREIRNHSERIERETLAPWLEATEHQQAPEMAVGLDLGEDPPVRSDWRDRLFSAWADDGEVAVAPPVLAAAKEIEEVRQQVRLDVPAFRMTSGRVWRIDAELSEVRAIPPSEDAFAFITNEILDAGLRLGDPVIVRHEELDEGLVLTSFERGLEATSRVSRVTGQPLPRHLDELLDESALQLRASSVQALRFIA